MISSVMVTGDRIVVGMDNGESIACKCWSHEHAKKFADGINELLEEIELNKRRKVPR